MNFKHVHFLETYFANCKFAKTKLLNLENRKYFAYLANKQKIK